MRIYFKKSILIVGFTSLLFILFVVLISKSEDDGTTKAEKLLSREISLQQINSGQNLQNFKDLWQSYSYNVSYDFLAGFPVQKQKYLAIGLSSVKRKRGNYVLETLKSIFEKSTDEELQEMVVVVHLADFDKAWNMKVAMDISTKFARRILSGHLLIIHAPQEHYPPLEGLKRNFNDAENRVTFRSKQNVDYAFLLNFCANLSSYYLMIEDDVKCSKSFFTIIKKSIASRKGTYWVTLEFSKLGYIGKLYHSSDLPRLAQFLLLFYQEMPCDWLLGHFQNLLAQKDVIRFKPSLFQHTGYYSSFLGTANLLKDDDFEEDPFDIPDNPPATIFTDINTFESYYPKKAYSNMDEYFWGKSPSAGNYFTIIFNRPVVLNKLHIHTGTDERKGDALQFGDVELGSQLGKSRNRLECSSYNKIGSFVDGRFQKDDIYKSYDSPVSCVKIVITKSQSKWLIIQNISIWTKQLLK
ncbi:alpha-1,3-mannosyl-glycoprotein 4-beta-N-acetylglucosaminyltransferase C-like [Polypterus senegalus]|uniref:alpha-1,3-mannosyl-glycoprotein 4-beta-N-acetylglucosaminyltransferase C-like n=1 Tax=Polypterus senegalus TaxID=55291 RepID=UPI0019631C5C|nr:alpha-1,3-mannosyl-glycoprotein 4-beta-N-acetylglucosaminyltransferase C-like [Polypterus senegalus]